jgi:DNA polymerase-3 subunit alpha
MDLFEAASSETASTGSVQPVAVSSREILEWEKELLGTYMSDHPLSEILQLVLHTEAGRSICEIAQLEEKSVGYSARVIAMVANVRRIVTKSDRSMAVAVLEDLSGRVDLVLFPDAFDRYAESLKEGAILDIRGRLERRGETLQVVCESISKELPTPSPDAKEFDSIVIRFRSGADSWTEIKAMQQVDEILKRYEGDSPVVIELQSATGSLCQLMSRTRRSDWSAALESELRAVPGVVAARLASGHPVRLAS